MNPFEYDYTEPGYCRVYYTWESDNGNVFNFCAQDEGKGQIVFYRCTGGDWNEPDHETNPKFAPPFSPGDTDIDKAVNEWIRNKWKVLDEQELSSDPTSKSLRRA